MIWNWCYETNTHFIGFPHFHYFISTYRPVQLVMHFLTRRFSNHVSHLLSRSHTFAIIVILDLKIHQSMWIYWPFFSKNLNQRALTPRWPLTPCLLGSHCVTLPKDHCVQVPWQYINLCGYSDEFCKIPHTYTYTYYIHRPTYYVQNEWSHSLLLNSVQARQKWQILNINHKMWQP